MQYAPIALFTYNRADHTQMAVDSLLSNAEAKESDLFIFSDGAKNENTTKGVSKNREYIHTVSGFKSVTIVEREENWGLSRSLITGITELTKEYGRVIVVEDDIIVSPYFLRYMNEALEKYENNDQISAVSAFLTPTEVKPHEPFFLRYFDCWGWGTWERAWELFNPNPKDLLRKMRWKKKEFDMGHVGGFYGTLYCQKIGLVDSWAIRFYASSFLANKLVLFPTETLTIQSGIDGTGIHCGKSDRLYENMVLSDKPQVLSTTPIVESTTMYNAYHKAFLRGKSGLSMKEKYVFIKSFIRRAIGLDYM